MKTLPLRNLGPSPKTWERLESHTKNIDEDQPVNSQHRRLRRSAYPNQFSMELRYLCWWCWVMVFLKNIPVFLTFEKSRECWIGLNLYYRFSMVPGRLLFVQGCLPLCQTAPDCHVFLIDYSSCLFLLFLFILVVCFCFLILFILKWGRAKGKLSPLLSTSQLLFISQVA